MYGKKQNFRNYFCSLLQYGVVCFAGIACVCDVAESKEIDKIAHPAATQPTEVTTAPSSKPAKVVKTRRKFDKVRGISLTRFKPLTATVNFCPLMVNKALEDKKPIINGEICTNFIFTHANSDVLYRIPSSAKYFYAIGYSLHSKNVKFIVKIGGEVVYESPLLHQVPEEMVEIKVALPRKAKAIELITLGIPTCEAAWSIWCEPTFCMKDPYPSEEGKNTTSQPADSPTQAK